MLRVPILDVADFIQTINRVCVEKRRKLRCKYQKAALSAAKAFTIKDNRKGGRAPVEAPLIPVHISNTDGLLAVDEEGAYITEDVSRELAIREVVHKEDTVDDNNSDVPND